jgi:hypothetical protein
MSQDSPAPHESVFPAPHEPIFPAPPPHNHPQESPLSEHPPHNDSHRGASRRAPLHRIHNPHDIYQPREHSPLNLLKQLKTDDLILSALIIILLFEETDEKDFSLIIALLFLLISDFFGV